MTVFLTANISLTNVQTRAALVVDKPAGVEDVWKNFKECLIEEAVEVYGETRGPSRAQHGHEKQKTGI